tara:strand:- start:91 stop:801 length:711 start_codon:yes stop_codon:yes gene_type:complete
MKPSLAHPFFQIGPLLEFWKGTNKNIHTIQIHMTLGHLEKTKNFERGGRVVAVRAPSAHTLRPSLCTVGVFVLFILSISTAALALGLELVTRQTMACSPATHYYHQFHPSRYDTEQRNDDDKLVSRLGTIQLVSSEHGRATIVDDSYITWINDMAYANGTETQYERAVLQTPDGYLAFELSFVRKEPSVDAFVTTTMTSTHYMVSAASGSFRNAKAVYLTPKNDLTHRPRTLDVKC